MDEGRFQVAVGGVIERPDGKILLIKRVKNAVWGGTWEFPIGRLKQFESIEDGLRREVKEESDITSLQIIMPLRAFSYMRGEERAENEVKGIVFWCKTAQSNARVSDEHDDLQWLSLEEALKIVPVGGLRKDLEAFKNAREAARKSLIEDN